MGVSYRISGGSIIRHLGSVGFSLMGGLGTTSRKAVNTRKAVFSYISFKSFSGKIRWKVKCETCNVAMGSYESEEQARSAYEDKERGPLHRCHNGAYYLEHKFLS